jgi:hypothetical protein
MDYDVYSLELDMKASQKKWFHRFDSWCCFLLQ